MRKQFYAGVATIAIVAATPVFAQSSGSIAVEDIIVTESMRGKGIGSLLFEKMQEECKTLGFNGMSWQVLDWNKPAIDFYETLGVKMDSGWLNVHLEL